MNADTPLSKQLIAADVRHPMIATGHDLRASMHDLERIAADHDHSAGMRYLWYRIGVSTAHSHQESLKRVHHDGNLLTRLGRKIAAGHSCHIALTVSSLA
jgi:hypothetical protein